LSLLGGFEVSTIGSTSSGVGKNWRTSRPLLHEVLCRPMPRLVLRDTITSTSVSRRRVRRRRDLLAALTKALRTYVLVPGLPCFASLVELLVDRGQQVLTGR